MGLAAIGIAILLFLILAIFTLMINPPNAWVNRATERRRRNPADPAAGDPDREPSSTANASGSKPTDEE